MHCIAVQGLRVPTTIATLVLKGWSREIGEKAGEKFANLSSHLTLPVGGTGRAT
jgi:hypothetical protein